MALDGGSPRSRRAVLAGAIGGFGAWAAAAMSRVAPARAIDHQAIIQGEDNSGSLGTLVRVSTTGPALQGLSDVTSGASYGLRGRNSSTQGAGVLGVAGSATGGVVGVLGQALNSSGGTGVRGEGKFIGVKAESAGNGGRGVEALQTALTGAGAGVYGSCSSPTGTGVFGVAHAGSGVPRGVRGRVESPDGIGVEGMSGPGSGSGIGIEGVGLGTLSIGVRGSVQDATGVLGFSGNGTVSGSTPKTGVYGYANQDASATGVSGYSPAGTGVRGNANSGVGVWAIANTGTALQASGKVKLNRSGKASIAANKSYVDVTPIGGLSGTPLPFANLISYRAGVYVAAVRPNYPTTAKLRIQLNKVASTTATTSVAWLVLG